MRQTVRRLRKRPIRVSDRLYLYWHIRRRDCEKLREAVCYQEFLLRFTPNSILVSDGFPWSSFRELPQHEAEKLARLEGFHGFKSMLTWFTRKYRNLFEEVFQVIRW